MKKGFVVSAVLYPLLVIALALIMGVISMSDNRRKILDNMKLEVSEESESDPEMTNSNLYYKIKALEEAYGELNARFSEEYFDQIKADYEEKIKNAKLQIFPVGSIYISTTSTNPSSYIGGTWEAYGSGKTLVGIDSSQTEFNEANKTGGSKTFNNSHSHTIPSHAHTTTDHTLTVAEMPSHTHNIIIKSDESITNGGNARLYQANVTAGTGWRIFTHGAAGVGYAVATATGGNASHNHGNTGESGVLTTNLSGDSTQSLLQPYITVYFWKRTA